MLKIAMSAAAALLGLQALPAAAQQNAPLAPSGKWVADFQEATCLLTRAYLDGERRYDLAFLPKIAGDEIEVSLVLPAGTRDYRESMIGTIELLPSGQMGQARYTKYERGGERGVVRMFIARGRIADLDSATSLRMLVNGKPIGHFALSRTGAALGTIAKCQDGLIAEWGFDPAVVHALSRNPEPIAPQSWVTDNDYPIHALRAGVQGNVRLRWTAGADGRATGCAVLQSSGAGVLDATACKLIEKRGRYRPALDANGAPVAVPQSSVVYWSLPR